MSKGSDDRSRQAIAYHWASRIVSVSLEMVIPGLLGYWLDEKLKTKAVFTIVGFAGGLTLGMAHLIRIARSGNRFTSTGTDSKRKNNQQ